MFATTRICRQIFNLIFRFLGLSFHTFTTMASRQRLSPFRSSAAARIVQSVFHVNISSTHGNTEHLDACGRLSELYLYFSLCSILFLRPCSNHRQNHVERLSRYRHHLSGSVGTLSHTDLSFTSDLCSILQVSIPHLCVNIPHHLMIDCFSFVLLDWIIVVFHY